MATVLITGGTGFIGRRLSRCLHKGGYQILHLVRAAGNQISTYPSIVARDFSREGIKAALSPISIDATIHLAAAGVHPGDRDPVRMFDVNVVATQAIIEASASAGAKVFLHAGSSAEYADMAASPLNSGSPLQSRRLYGASKAASTLAAAALAPAMGMSCLVLRLYNVYGPGEAEHRLLPSLVSRLRAGEEVALSAGTQERDFVHVDDVCGAFSRALEFAPRNSGVILDVCTGTSTTVRAFAEMVADEVGASRRLLRFGALELRPDDLAKVVGDPTAMLEILEFRAQTTVSSGVRAAVQEMQLPMSQAMG